MKKFFCILLCILWMGFIYYNSSQSGMDSHRLTNKIVDKLITVSEKIQEERTNEKKVYAMPGKLILQDNLLIEVNRGKLNNQVRKVAHAFEFFILSCLLCNAFFACNKKGRRAFIDILFIVLLYAVIDEYHQLYVVDRTSSVKDVLIDFIGGILGVDIYYMIYYVWNYLYSGLKKVRKT